MEEISTIAMFEYGREKKIRFLVTSLIIMGILVLAVIMYFLLLQHLDIAFFTFIGTFAQYIKSEISNATTAGIFYTALVGGLFFVTLPTEIVFIGFLKQGANPYIAVTAFIVGFAISHTVNYIIGQRLDHIAKKIITSKKFYKVKGMLNKYGAVGIFLANAIPFLPAQPLSAILGVFNYNKTKFYLYLLTGQLVKFAAIATIFAFIM